MRNLWIHRADCIYIEGLRCPVTHQVLAGDPAMEKIDRVLPSGTRILVVIYSRKKKRNKTISASAKCYEGNETGPYGRGD